MSPPHRCVSPKVPRIGGLIFLDPVHPECAPHRCVSSEVPRIGGLVFLDPVHPECAPHRCVDISRPSSLPNVPPTPPPPPTSVCAGAHCKTGKLKTYRVRCVQVNRGIFQITNCPEHRTEFFLCVFIKKLYYPFPFMSAFSKSFGKVVCKLDGHPIIPRERHA
jgi:hypothetical protein